MIGAELLARWAEPRRAYHDLGHLAAVLDAVDLLASSVHGTDLRAVRFAAWFHDAVHDGRAGADEEASAALAAQSLAVLGVPPHVVAEAVRLVRTTAEHDPAPDDASGALLCDADLAVLGSEPPAYAAYAEAVRREYADVPDTVFRAGRTQVLRRLLALDPLYRTVEGRRRWEAAARRNVQAELAQLAGEPPH